MSNSLSGTDAISIIVDVASGDWKKEWMDEMDKRRAAADKRRGYRIEQKDIHIPDEVPLSEFLSWASNLHKEVPQEYLSTAVVVVNPTYEGLESFVSWHVPLK